MFKQYIKDHEMTMRIEHKNIFKLMLSRQQSTAPSTVPFLTDIYQRQNKDTDLLDFLFYFDKCMSQLTEDKKVIISILQEIGVAEENMINMCLRDLSLFALAESTLEKKYLIKRIMTKYNL